MPDRVSTGYQDHHGEPQICETLLKLKAPVCGEKDLEAGTLCAPK